MSQAGDDDDDKERPPAVVNSRSDNAIRRDFASINSRPAPLFALTGWSSHRFSSSLYRPTVYDGRLLLPTDNGSRSSTRVGGVCSDAWRRPGEGRGGVTPAPSPPPRTLTVAWSETERRASGTQTGLGAPLPAEVTSERWVLDPRRSQLRTAHGGHHTETLSVLESTSFIVGYLDNKM